MPQTQETPMRHRPPLPALAAAALLALSTTACGEATSSSAEPGRSTDRAVSAGGAAEPGDAEPAEVGRPLEAPRPLATARTTDGNGAMLLLTLTDVRRTGDLVTVNWSVSNEEDPNDPYSEELELDDFFEDGKAGEDDDETTTDVDGAYLLDGQNGTRLPVARDATGTCVCTRMDAAATLLPDETVEFTATFGAPPADVTSIDVSIPHVRTFTDVPLG